MMNCFLICFSTLLLFGASLKNYDSINNDMEKLNNYSKSCCMNITVSKKNKTSKRCRAFSCWPEKEEEEEGRCFDSHQYLPGVNSKVYYCNIDLRNQNAILAPFLYFWLRIFSILMLVGPLILFFIFRPYLLLTH